MNHVVYALGSADIIDQSPLHNNNLRGEHHNGDFDNNNNIMVNLSSSSYNIDFMHRSLNEQQEGGRGDASAILLSQPLSFQITMSIILGMIILIQLVLLATFIYHRTKRVLEFAQPIVICIFIACGIITTSACYLFIYTTSNIGCAIREPVIFICLSLMGATIAGRAWRISTLMNNPLTNIGKKGSSSDVPRIERARQFMLHMLTKISGGTLLCCSNQERTKVRGGGGRSFRVTITFAQMMRTILILILPQVLLQIVILAVPSLRSAPNIVYHDYYGVTVGQATCQSSTAVSGGGSSWQLYVSIIFALLPYCLAYLLNVRPKTELEQLPDIIDERKSLRLSFAIFTRVLVIAAPVIGLTLYAPAARAYATISSVLGLPLALCYHIAYVKLESSTMTSKKQQRFSVSSFDGSNGDKSSAAVAVKMAEMYAKIGRTEETIQLVEETLSAFRKGSSGGVGHSLVDGVSGVISNLGQSDGRNEVASGFAKNDLKALEADDLQLIIELLRIKSSAIIKLHGNPGLAMSAKTNIDALKIFENCPAAADMKDISIIFPIYNLVGLQLKGGVIDQDDECSLENDLAEKYVYEAQTQVFHYARALAYLAEFKGRTGAHDEAFKYFEIMKSIYMPAHSKLLSKAYAIDKCAVCIGISSLWFLQKGDTEGAIERCEYVINEILPSYDKTDIIGLYTILLALIRVLKWNGGVDKARDVYNTAVPEGIEKHFAVGHLHKPMLLLLKICDGSSEQYDTVQSSDIELALNFDPADMPDKSFMCDGFSMKSASAEICLHLARRMPPGSGERERLVDKGIEQSNIANERVTASNGMIKHLLAYEGNKDIQIRLIELKKEDTTVGRSSIYKNNVHTNDPLDGSTTTKSSTKTSTTGISIANRFIVKDDPSKTSSNGSSGLGKSLSSSTPCHVVVARKKVVGFSHISSLLDESNRSSKHSNNSQS